MMREDSSNSIGVAEENSPSDGPLMRWIGGGLVVTGLLVCGLGLWADHKPQEVPFGAQSVGEQFRDIQRGLARVVCSSSDGDIVRNPATPGDYLAVSRSLHCRVEVMGQGISPR